LNWSDGQSALGGNVVKPNKRVWLEERPADTHSSTFAVYQVYGNLLRRALAQVGGRTERLRDTIAAAPSAGGLVRSEKTWKVAAATGFRTRATYVFRNDSGLNSPPLMAHRMATVDVNGAGQVGVVAPPIGTSGKGSMSGQVVFATDPKVRFRLVQPWHDDELALADLVREDFTDVHDPRVDPGDGALAFQEMFSQFLPAAAPQGWSFELPADVEAGEGAVVPFSIGVSAGTPGRSLIAIQVEDIDDPSKIACSEILALEVTEQLEIRLFSDVEPQDWSERIELPYLRGSLSARELNDELERLWLSLQEDGDLLVTATAAGIDVSALPRDVSPFEVVEGAVGFAPGSIVVRVSGLVARDIWREVLLPRIKEEHGADALHEERPRD
jgi:hypothetical protein